MPDSVDFLMKLAGHVSNHGRPESDNNYGRAASEIKQLRAALDANICCPECGFVGPAKDWEISDSGHSIHRGEKT